MTKFLKNIFLCSPFAIIGLGDIFCLFYIWKDTETSIIFPFLGSILIFSVTLGFIIEFWEK